MLPRHFLYNFICAFRSLARPGLLALVLYPCFSEASLSCASIWGYRTRIYRTRNYGKTGVQNTSSFCSVPLCFEDSLFCTLYLGYRKREYRKTRVQNISFFNLKLFCTLVLSGASLSCTPDLFFSL